MRAVVQRVKESRVKVNGKIVGEIKAGLLVFLGIKEGDESEDVNYLVEKILNLRIFSDQEGNLNFSALQQKKSILVVPQFTLYGNCHQGRRPSFSSAASPAKAKKLYDRFVAKMNQSELKIETGQFQSLMEVEIVNDGPVTMLIDSSRLF